MRRLDVYLHGAMVGHLESPGQGRLFFRYLPEWVEKQGLPLSQSLPVRMDPFDDDQARPYFAGLLPEGDFLRTVARAFSVSAGNAFSLLDAIGGECAGAVSLTPAGQPLPELAPPEWLGLDELEVLVESLPVRTFDLMKAEGGLRLSLAGAQEKLPVVFDGGQVGITRGAPPSTHILKIPDRRFPELVAVEGFCMALAREAGLDVATAHPHGVSAFEREQDSFEYLLVERYDRSPGADVTERLHQEDFCQALGVVSEQKYESEGGPGFASCSGLIREVSAVPAIDVQKLIAAVLFNFLIGNNDAHGKNFSLLVEGDGAPRLAPLYDLVSTVVLPGMGRKMAMKVGGEYRPDRVERRHWQRFADDLGVGFKTVLGQAEALLLTLPAAQVAARTALGEFAERPVVAAVEIEIERRSSWLRRGLGPA